MNPLEAQKMFAEIMQNLNINEEAEPELEQEADNVQIEEVSVPEKLNTIDETTEQEQEPEEEDSDEDEEDLTDNSEPLVVPQME